MSKITVFTNLTLDGVMQAPGWPDKDTSKGVVIATYESMNTVTEILGE